MIYYTYNAATKKLSPVPRVITMPDGSRVANPSAEQYAVIGAHPLAEIDAPIAPEGKVAIPDGYALSPGQTWLAQYRFADASSPALADYDAAMEEHLFAERVARGYTTREPDAYLASSVPRWAQDARDWVLHRDAVMSYALALINAVEAGTQSPPTLAEFKSGLPCIEWTAE